MVLILTEIDLGICFKYKFPTTISRFFHITSNSFGCWELRFKNSQINFNL